MLCLSHDIGPLTGVFLLPTFLIGVYFLRDPFHFFFKSWVVLVSTWSMCCCVGDKLVCASLNGSVEGNGWYLYGILHGFVAHVKSTNGEQTDWWGVVFSLLCFLHSEGVHFIFMFGTNLVFLSL
jgi:hypothetical protein